MPAGIIHHQHDDFVFTHSLLLSEIMTRQKTEENQMNEFREKRADELKEMKKNEEETNKRIVNGKKGADVRFMRIQKLQR